MWCTAIIKRECPFGHKCSMKLVADDSECAELILSVRRRSENADAVEAEYLRQERQAIQEEVEHVKR